MNVQGHGCISTQLPARGTLLQARLGKQRKAQSSEADETQ